MLIICWQQADAQMPLLSLPHISTVNDYVTYKPYTLYLHKSLSLPPLLTSAATSKYPTCCAFATMLYDPNNTSHDRRASTLQYCCSSEHTWNTALLHCPLHHHSSVWSLSVKSAQHQIGQFLAKHYGPNCISKNVNCPFSNSKFYL